MMTKQIECEVLVVGGGVAGLCAAITAARAGAQTILIEKNNFPGGTAVIGLHRFICGLYLNGTQIPKATLNIGIVREIVAGLKMLAPAANLLKMGRVYVLPFATCDLVSVFRSLSENMPRLLLSYNTQAVSVEYDQGKIISVTANDLLCKINIKAGVIIDCSGDGAIIKMAGLQYRSATMAERQLAGFAFRIKGIYPADEMASIKVPYYLAKAAKAKKIPLHLKFTTFALTDDSGEGFCRLSIPPGLAAGLDAAGLDADRDRNLQAQANARLVHSILKKKIPAFQNSCISKKNSSVVDREGIRLDGKFLLTAKDVLSGEKFFNGIVKNSWPIEFWDQNLGPYYKYLLPDDYYTIPSGCLKDKIIKNFLCAGRCISVTGEALGSTRVMGTCMSLGEQAGMAACEMIR